MGLELQEQGQWAWNSRSMGALFSASLLCMCARVAKGVHVCFMLVCMSCLCSPGSLCLDRWQVIMHYVICQVCDHAGPCGF